MTAPPLVARDTLAAEIGRHFIMWHELDGSPPGEWRCVCRLRFGFSDSAIAHVADALLASPLFRDPATLADDEALVEETRSRVGLDGNSRFMVSHVLRALAAALSEGTE